MSGTESDDSREWFAKAEKDRAAALLILADPALTDIACYHAQQTAEKYLKGHLKRRGVAFRWAHDLTYLINLCQKTENSAAQFASFADDAEWLTRTADASRYPGDGIVGATVEDARRALTIAERIRTVVLAIS